MFWKYFLLFVHLFLENGEEKKWLKSEIKSGMKKFEI